MLILSGQCPARPGPARLPVVSSTINSEQKRLDLISRLPAGKESRVSGEHEHQGADQQAGAQVRPPSLEQGSFKHISWFSG